MNSQLSKTIIRKLKRNDMESVLEIWKEGRLSLKKRGVSQWQRGDYPGVVEFFSDLEKGSGMVVEREGVVVAVFAFTLIPEPSYSLPLPWQTDEGEYLTIHRSAVKEEEKGKGIFSLMVSWCTKEARRNGKKSIRIDTHEDNTYMIRALKKNNFVEVGRLILLSGSEKGDYRLGFEKLV